MVKADTPALAPASATEAVSTANLLAGSYATDPIAVTQMVDVARQAGFEEKDVAEFAAGTTACTRSSSRSS